MKTQLLCIAILLSCAIVTLGDDAQSKEVKKTESAAPKPESAAVNPESAAVKPESAVQKPESPVQKPDSAVEKPANSAVLHSEEQTKPKKSDSVESHDNATTPKSSSDVSLEHHGEGFEVSDSMFNATKRAAYLLTGVCVLVLLYFLWRSYSLKRRQTHIHKYGVVASREDLEMTSLGFGSEDEEDDTTHFDIGRHQRS